MEEKINNVMNFDIKAITIFKIFVIFGVVAVIYLLRDLVLVILTAVVLASAINPAANWFVRRRIPRTISVLLVYLITITVVLLILYFFIPPVFQDFSGLIGFWPEKVNDFINNNPAWNSVLALISPLPASVSIQEVIGKGLLDSPLPQNVFEFVQSIFNGIFSFILIVVISFYLAVQKDGVKNFLRTIVPVKHEEYVIDLWSRTEVKIGRWMQGQLLLGVIIGSLVFLGLMIFNIKYALLLAILAALFELIPVFGPILASVPAVALGFSESFTHGLVIIGFYVIIQQFENHLIYPLVVKKMVGVNSLIVIISLIVGYQLGGFLGIILAVPVATLLMEYISDLDKKKHHVV